MSRTNEQNQDVAMINYIAKLEQENRELIKVLRFYADRNNYTPVHDTFVGAEITMIDIDEGEKARQLLQI